MKPRFQHDCAACTFVGFINKYDLYTCKQGHKSPTMIARFGNKREDYVSGPRLTLDDITFELTLAWLES